MFGYYMQLAFRSLKRSPALTVLMMLAIGFGVAASTTTYAVFRGVSGDPIPWKSAHLFVPQMDMWGPNDRAGDGEPPDQLGYADALALMRDHQGTHESPIYAVSPTVIPDRPGQGPVPVQGYAVTAGFFPMLDVPFRHGGGWSAADGAREAAVAVIGEQLNRQVFGGRDSVGQILDVDGVGYRVVGVMADWNPQPIFFDVMDTGGYGGNGPDLFVPFQRAIASHMDNTGVTHCRKDGMPADTGFTGLMRSDCVWMTYLVELADGAAVRRYRQYLDDYARDQQAIGRLNGAPNNRLRDLPAFLEHEHVVPDDTRISLVLALALLLVCLVNTVGLLLARFLRRSGEIGVRRALGASRRAIHAQFLTEAVLIGVGGGVLGLVLTGVGVLGVGQVLPPRIAELARIDPALLALTMLAAMASSVLAGLYPVFRAARVQPAWQLKSH